MMKYSGVETQARHNMTHCTYDLSLGLFSGVLLDAIQMIKHRYDEYLISIFYMLYTKHTHMTQARNGDCLLRITTK